MTPWECTAGKFLWRKQALLIRVVAPIAPRRDAAVTTEEPLKAELKRVGMLRPQAPRGQVRRGLLARRAEEQVPQRPRRNDLARAAHAFDATMSTGPTVMVRLPIGCDSLQTAL